MSMHNPPHPSEVLKELYLDPLDITVTDAAKALNTSPEVWVNLQAKFDLWNAKQNLSVKDVKTLRKAA